MRRLLALALALVACGPPEGRPEPRGPKDKAKELACPTAPEPEREAVVVATIGPLHLVESLYPLSRLGDVLATFKPDLVLVSARVDAFREGHLEEASFETTYVTYLARQRGVAVEPIDWWRDEDRGAASPPVEPWDAAEIERRETAVLSESRLLTFDKANADDLRDRIWLANLSRARHRGGDPVAARRRAWMQQMTQTAVARHGRPRRVLAFVDVTDRPAIDHALHGAGYPTSGAASVVSRAKEVMVSDVPGDVVAEWKGELARAHDRAAKAEAPADKAFWATQERVLSVAAERRGACCVTESALAAGR